MNDRPSVLKVSRKGERVSHGKMGHIRDVYQGIQSLPNVLNLVIVHVQLGQIHQRLHYFGVQRLDVVLT